LVLLIIVYTLCSTKLEIRANQFLPGSEGMGGSRRGWGEKEEGRWEGGRNDPNIVCIYELKIYIYKKRE
jgi:hypothetical protein